MALSLSALFGNSDQFWLQAASARQRKKAMIIDTHVHIYDPFRPEGAPWPEPDDLIYVTTRPYRCK